jgi:hypothetical protein
MAGAAIGTVVPGAGNVVGAVAGFAVGLAVGLGAQALWDKHVKEPAVEFLSNGLGAYAGVAENIKVIGKVASDRAGQAISSTVDAVKDSVESGVEAIGNSVKDTIQNAKSTVSNLVGNLFGG